MANYICPECGADVYWSPPMGQFQTSGYSRLCDECLEVKEAEEAVAWAKALDKSIEADAFPNK